MRNPDLPIATFCGNCNCGCPQLFLDSDAPADKRVRITDDFGQQIQMSREQFADLLAQAKSGALDDATATATATA
ncbi:hypothetical protein ACIRST_17275 [Kitasatospora sp. NPDC101447]|uniref:hypothetical protein n=1 Tax=Kitasatospora sp. NPDC101447 TaxID=3364102 RepID=UPI00382C8C0A